MELKKPLAKYIDHTLLKPDATPEDIKKLCAEAREYGFASVCVNSCYAALASAELEGSGVEVCCVVGFPLGAMDMASKAIEARNAVAAGAQEIDMVMNIGRLKGVEYEYVRADIATVVQTAGVPVKVIIETCLLSDDEKRWACQIAEQAGAAFVKTSTGFSSGGATVEDVRLMRSAVSDKVRVKAAGGIRDYQTAMAMIEAGADRLGASAGIAILKGARGGMESKD